MGKIMRLLSRLVVVIVLSSVISYGVLRWFVERKENRERYKQDGRGQSVRKLPFNTVNLHRPLEVLQARKVRCLGVVHVSECPEPHEVH